MKNLSIIFLLIGLNSFSQILGDLKYSSSSRTYVAPPTSERRNFVKIMEQRYLTNQKSCNELKRDVLSELNSLTIDSINLQYRDGLKRNLTRIRTLQSERNFADYTMEIDDIINDLNINSN